MRADFVSQYGDLALETIDITEYGTSKILDTLSAQPFLSPRRMVVMQGLTANKSAGEAIDKLLQAVSDTTDLIITESKIDKRSVLYKTLKKQTDMQEFLELDVRDAPRWLTNEAIIRGATISLADATYLVNRVGFSQQLLSSELDKLITYDKNILRKNIDALTEQAPLSTVFELIEAAFAGNIKKAMQLYDDQRAQNVEPLGIEALFVWQLHILLLIKSAGQKTPDYVAAEAGISPYVTKKSAPLARMRTLAELKHYVTVLADAEYSIKTTGVDADEHMKNYILLLGQ